MIIGLGYRARTGKDTIAKHLVENHGFTRLAFADALKAVALDAGGEFFANERWDDGGGLPVRTVGGLVHEGGWEKAKEYPLVRRYLQHLGVAMRAHVDPDVWVTAVRNQLDGLAKGTDVVITDVRFPNEYHMIRRYGGLLVEVTRPDVVSNAGDHISETALSDFPWPWEIVNDGDLTHLVRQVDGFLEKTAGLRT